MILRRCSPFSVLVRSPLLPSETALHTFGRTPHLNHRRGHPDDASRRGCAGCGSWRMHACVGQRGLDLNRAAVGIQASRPLHGCYRITSIGATISRSGDAGTTGEHSHHHNRNKLFCCCLDATLMRARVSARRSTSPGLHQHHACSVPGASVQAPHILLGADKQ